MFKLTGTMTDTRGRTLPVHHLGSATDAQRWLVSLKKHGYTADLTATVTTGAGSVTYKIIVE